jgi:hypothetical protein
MEIIEPFFKFNDADGAADKLVEEAIKCWKKV